MKTEKLVFLIFACFGLLFGCNNDEMPGDDLAGINLKKASAPAIFMVEPSGSDDTPAFMQAFDDAKAAGPGSVVQLVEGEYHLGFIEIRDFYGTFMGAGKGKSIITAMNNLNLDSLITKGLFPALMKFVGGDVKVCHFTIRTPEGRISVGGPGYGHVSALLCFTAYNPEYESLNESRSAKAMVDNVCLKGQKVEDGGIGYNYKYNAYFGLLACADYMGWPNNTVPRQKVDITVTNSEFDTFCYALVLQSLKNSKFVIGEKNSGNTFRNSDQAGGFWEGRDNELIMTGNTFNVPPYSWGFDADDYPWYPYLKNEIPVKPSLINISDNVFNLEHAEYAMLLRNRRTYTNPGDIPIAFQVKNNQFNMTDGYEWGILCYVTDGAVLRNNKFSGHGDLALYIINRSKNGLVLGNNFSTATLETGVAYLASNTQNWTFVGGDFTDKVIDLGVNNVFTGMNVSTADEPLGRSISEKLVPMNHMMK